MYKPVFDKNLSDKDKKRARNILTGKKDERVNQGIGYKKGEDFHKEGDIWESDGKKWTIKDGILQNITKLDIVKKKYLTPIFCPECKDQMNHKFDSKFYKKHGKCYDCVIKFETELKRLGIWKEYETNIINGNIDGIIKDFTAYIYDRLEESERQYITEQGVMEKWDGKLDRDRVLEAMNGTIEYLKSLKR